MKKTIITVFAFIILFGFAVSSVIAQEWSWSQPITITAPTSGYYEDIEFFPLYPAISGRVSESVNDDYEPLILGGTLTSSLTFTNVAIAGQGIKSVFAPPVGTEYIIDADTVALRNGSGYVALDPQPFIPTLEGEFTSIAAGPDGKLYVLFDASDSSQYLLEGTSLIPWEVVKVRFSPRSLNLGSNGNWVTCKISDFPDGYTPADVDMDRVCIVAVNGKFLAETANPICSKDSGGPFNNRNKKKLIVKFDRKELAAFIAANPITDEPNIAKITVTGYGTDETLQFYGEDTIKTKPAKPPKEPKPKKK